MNKAHSAKRLIPLLAALMFIPLSAHAAEQPSFGEPPRGFKIGYQEQLGGESIVELVPQKQTVQNWTQMVTLQIFMGDRRDAPSFRNGLAALWQNACPQSSFNPIGSGRENGYPFTLFQLTCRHNPQTGKPEHAWVKAVRGNDGLYVKQYAFRYAPDKAEQNTAVEHLNRFSVCDNTMQHPCRTK